MSKRLFTIIVVLILILISSACAGNEKVANLNVGPEDTGREYTVYFRLNDNTLTASQTLEEVVVPIFSKERGTLYIPDEYIKEINVKIQEYDQRANIARHNLSKIIEGGFIPSLIYVNRSVGSITNATEIDPSWGSHYIDYTLVYGGNGTPINTSGKSYILDVRIPEKEDDVYVKVINPNGVDYMDLLLPRSLLVKAAIEPFFSENPQEIDLGVPQYFTEEELRSNGTYARNTIDDFIEGKNTLIATLVMDPMTEDNFLIRDQNIKAMTSVINVLAAHTGKKVKIIYSAEYREQIHIVEYMNTNEIKNTLFLLITSSVKITQNTVNYTTTTTNGQLRIDIYLEE